MDAKLLSWARAVKRPGGVPPLWLFTDARRLPDPLPAIRALPPGLAGVVFRPDNAAPELGHAIARACRARRIALVVAGNTRLAASLGTGLHLRRGFWPGGPKPRLPASALLTSSAHSRIELVRARRRGADLVFLSPAFATASHAGARPLGSVRWNALVRASGVQAAALGGISGVTIRRLGRRLSVVGAITALAPEPVVA